MKINVIKLGWKDKCCGCNRKIKAQEKVYMLSEVAGVNGSIHLCESCIDAIGNSKDKNIDTEIYQDFTEFLSK